jgi:hypothetical protein
VICDVHSGLNILAKGKPQPNPAAAGSSGGSLLGTPVGGLLEGGRATLLLHPRQGATGERRLDQVGVRWYRFVLGVGFCFCSLLCLHV